jgi:hypothetical protein
MKVFFANAHPKNWPMCKTHNIFGVRQNGNLPAIDPGDMILVRVTGKNYGVIAIWLYESTEKVKSDTFVPWKDAKYDWILNCKPVVDEFLPPFNEGFSTKHKSSTKINGLFASRLLGSIGLLKSDLALGYLKCILEEKYEQMNGTINFTDQSVMVNDYVLSMLSNIEQNNNGESTLGIESERETNTEGKKPELVINENRIVW